MPLAPEELLIIHQNPVLGGLSVDALKRVIDHNPPRDYTKKSMLFQEGDKADHFYIVISGIVKLFRCSLDGNEAVIGVFGKGQAFAECAMFMGACFPVNAEVVADARLLRIDGATMRRVIQDDPGIAFTMLASASRHLKQLVDQIEQMRTHTGPERVAQFLIGLSSSKLGRESFTLPFGKSLIANTLGMKPESFSRALAKLRDVGVTIDGDHVVIAEISTLIRFAKNQAIEEQGTPLRTQRPRIYRLIQSCEILRVRNAGVR